MKNWLQQAQIRRIEL